MKLLNKINLGLIGLYFGIANVFAELPKIAPPSKGAGNDILATIKNYGYDFVIVFCLAIGSIAFLAVCSNTISAYKEVQDKKGTWGNVGTNAIVGILLLVLVIYLLTQAMKILD